MSDDIFHSWKHSRFVVADYELFDDASIVVVLTDFKFWAQHTDGLEAWCREHGGRIKGITVSLDTHEQLTLFALKWS